MNDECQRCGRKTYVNDQLLCGACSSQKSCQQPVDNLWTTRQKRAQVIHNLRMPLTAVLRCHRVKRAAEAESSQARMQLTGKLCLFIGLLLQTTIPSAQAIGTKVDADHYKLYAHSRIITWSETRCFIALIDKENRHWNPKAKNGSHYGIGQMRNTKYRELDGYRQIDWTLRYIAGRYSTPCKAWEFFKANGYH
jgi:hypothetical protein